MLETGKSREFSRDYPHPFGKLRTGLTHPLRGWGMFCSLFSLRWRERLADTAYVHRRSLLAGAWKASIRASALSGDGSPRFRISSLLSIFTWPSLS